MRLLTFTAVIAVHAIAFTEPPSDRVAAGAMMLLQFGRNIFFTISAFVLVYAAASRPIRAGRFWRRRYVYVVVPYVAWTLLYEAYSTLGPAHARWSLTVFGRDLLYGGAKYHLYFLLVTMQLYLVFPALLSFARRTAPAAWRVLSAVVVLNVAWLAVVQWVPAPRGPAAWLWQHAYELLPTYSMYVLAGCYAALHLPALQRFVERRPRHLIAAAAGLALAAVGVYAVQLPFFAPRVAASVVQPANLLSSAGAVILLYLVGSRWAGGPRRWQGTVAMLSDASFGVYLAHPFVLQLMLDHGLGNSAQALPAPLATVLGLAGAIGGGLAITLVARRTPLSLALTGRSWKRPARSGAAVVATVHRLAAPAIGLSQQSPNSA